MRLEKSVEDKYTIIKLLDEKLDSRISPDLKGEFINLNAQGSRNIILNLDDVKYVDSSGLSAILTAKRLCGTSGGILVLCHLNNHVEKLIKISHLESVLNILPTQEEAVQEVFMAEIENEVSGDAETL
ncbi:MAG: STAS domain-containing protein [Bacteroidia bacterium]|nr:STAS domain-containing protein [Bacteroidia bacterium]